MRIEYKVTIFIVMTILFILLAAYLVSHILGITDIGIATFVGVTLLCVYMMYFCYINDKTMWMKF